MTLLLKLDWKDCLDNLHRWEGPRVSYVSRQYYDQKGKGEDYRETVLIFGNEAVYYYDHNDLVEHVIEGVMRGGYMDEEHDCWVSQSSDFLDLSSFEGTTEKKPVPNNYKRVTKVI